MWIHPEVAISLAMRLSPKSHVACIKVVRAYLEGRLQSAPVAEVSMAEMTLKVVLHLNGELDSLAPKAAFADEICRHDKLFLVEDVAKVLGMTARKLNKFLHSKGVIFNRGDGAMQSWTR